MFELLIMIVALAACCLLLVCRAAVDGHGGLVGIGPFGYPLRSAVLAAHKPDHTSCMIEPLS